MSMVMKTEAAGRAAIPLRAWALGLVFACAATAGTALKPTQMLSDTLPAVELETMIPVQFDDWKAVEKSSVVAVDPSVQRNLDATYEQLLARTYRNTKGQEVMLTVAYGRAQTHELKAHRQEVCYRAQGFEIRFVRPENAALKREPVPLSRMHAERPGRSEPVSYWFTMGDKVVYSIPERLFAGIRYSFADKTPDGFLVRISTISDQPRDAFALHDSFGKALLDGVSPEARMRLSGI